MVIPINPQAVYQFLRNEEDHEYNGLLSHDLLAKYERMGMDDFLNLLKPKRGVHSVWSRAVNAVCIQSGAAQ